MKATTTRFFVATCVTLTLAFSAITAPAQNSNTIVRLARLEIDSAKLDAYKAFLKEEIEASIRLEPGVWVLNAVEEKNKPTHITILEIYADTAAYQAHLQTPHFKKYKSGTAEMVKSLELIPTRPVMLGIKPDITKRLKR